MRVVPECAVLASQLRLPWGLVDVSVVGGECAVGDERSLAQVAPTSHRAILGREGENKYIIDARKQDKQRHRDRRQQDVRDKRTSLGRQKPVRVCCLSLELPYHLLTSFTHESRRCQSCRWMQSWPWPWTWTWSRSRCLCFSFYYI